MKQTPEQGTGLPDNAFTPLAQGEEYQPVIPPHSPITEITPWSVTWGIIMAIIFSAATAFLGLKIGQVFEAAIPIAIIAVGVSSASKRKGMLGQNVIIQSIGASSGMIVAGAIFTLPALYILQERYPEMTVSFFEVFFASLLGGILGILLLIPFRKYFVKEMHGKYPFPEATATTQVLVTGEQDGGQARPLLIAGLVGGLYDFLASTFGTWNEVFTSRVIVWGDTLAEKAKILFQINTGAAVLGMGYIVGLKYAAIICFGSMAVWWLIVPAIAMFWGETVVSAPNALHIVTAAQASPEEIYGYAKSIGIGGIAMAGIIGIIKSWGVIKGALSLAGREMGGKGQTTAAQLPRTQRDIPMKIISIGTVVTLLVIFLFFQFDVMRGNLLYAIIGVVIVAVIAFLFTTVAANAIAIVGSNPVSGMTLMTLILASVIMAAVGLNGSAGMVAALIMGGVVCTALSTAGSFITDLKIGYWLGSTPQKQETFKFLGTLVSAATVGGVIFILNKSYGFTSGELAAPQANAMAAVIEPLMSGNAVPWLLYGIGAVIAIILTCCGVSALAFTLGMFIPLHLNLPLLVGGLISYYVLTRSKDAAVNKANNDRGTLIASGFIAGGALMGVVSSAMRYAGLTFINDSWINSDGAQWVSLFVYLGLIYYFVKASLYRKE